LEIVLIRLQHVDIHFVTCWWFSIRRQSTVQRITLVTSWKLWTISMPTYHVLTSTSWKYSMSPLQKHSTPTSCAKHYISTLNIMLNILC